MQHDAVQHVEWWMHKREESGFGNLGSWSVTSIPRHQTTWKRRMCCKHCSSCFKQFFENKDIVDMRQPLRHRQEPANALHVQSHDKKIPRTLNIEKNRIRIIMFENVFALKTLHQNHSHVSNYKMFCHRSKQSICVCTLTLTNDVCKWLSKGTYLISVPPKVGNQSCLNHLKNKNKLHLYCKLIWSIFFTIPQYSC